MADVFVSYASEDRDRVAQIVSELERRGYSVWWDRRIDLGTSFDRSIEAELDAASCVLVVWSKASVQSEWVLNEASEGQGRGILVPVRIDDVRVPLAFRRLQTADVDPQHLSGFDPVLDAVARHVAGGPASRSAPRAASETPALSGRRVAGLVALVIVLSGTSAAWLLRGHTGESSTEDALRPKRIAVLPFQDLSPGQDQQWLADGIQVRVTQIIASSTGYRLVPTRLAVRMIDEESIGELDLLLTGTLQQERDENRLIVELTDVKSKAQIWIQEFVSGSEDLFESQQRMALRVARYFDTTLDSTSVPQAPGAWSPYLKYLHYQWGGAFDQEVYWLDQTLREDPDWSPGWSALTSQLIRRAGVLKDDNSIEQARAAADMACRSSGSGDPFCNQASAELALWIDGDFAQAERILRENLIENGWFFSYGLLLLASGLTEEAAVLFKRGSDINLPFFPAAWDWLSVAQGIMGDEQSALATANVFARLVPEDSVVPDLDRGIIAAKLGRIGEAEEIARRFDEAASRADNSSDYEHFTRFGSHLISAKTHTIANDYARAKRAADDLLQMGAMDFAAAVYLELGDETAIELFREAASQSRFYRRGLPYLMLYLETDLHDHPAVVDFLSALGQTPEWKRELCGRIRDLEQRLRVTCADRAL